MKPNKVKNISTVANQSANKTYEPRQKPSKPSNQSATGAVNRMKRYILGVTKVFTSTAFFGLPRLLVLIILLGSTSSVFAQQAYEHSKDKVDQTLRSNARINPSTLAVELTIPIADLPGRGGASMPLVFNYSSKVWQLRAEGEATVNQADVRPVYSDDAMAGWTSSYFIPTIDAIVEPYDCRGNSTGGDGVLPSGCGAYRYVKRIRVKMPGGTTHELRKDDLTHVSTNNVMDKTGTFYAVDGTRVRLEWGTGGESTLFLPDGGRYFFDSSLNCYKYIDRNGNRLTYNSATGAWTDTLGRTLASPIPFTHTQRQNQAEGTQSFTVPGLGSATRQYQLVWKKLSSGALLTGQSMSYVTNLCGSSTSRSPLLFENTTKIIPCDGTAGYFDPVVLSEIILPNGQKYEFAYTSYGEIARIDYPTGAYEKFIYSQITGLGWDYQRDYATANSYGQANRGVVNRYVGADGVAAEQHWHYSAAYATTVTYGAYTYVMMTTAPDGTSSKRFLHRVKRPLNDGYGNYGFDTVLAGMEMETQTLDSDGAIRSRKLFEWETTNGADVGSGVYPQRDARVKREINIIFEPNSSDALATMSETAYDTADPIGSTDVAYFSSLNAKQSKSYHYVALNATMAETANLTTLAGYFTAVQLAGTTEIDYLYDANYKARNITGLATETRIKDAAGIIKAKSQISYDEIGYALSSTGVMPAAAANSWLDPLVELGATAGAKRGLPTTVRSYSDVATSQFIETHSFYDQYGNLRRVRDARGKDTENEYDDDYAFAYSTKVTTPIPDPSGANGSNAAFVTTSVYDYNTGLPTSTKDANNLETRIEYNDPLLRPTKAQNYFGGLPIGAASETVYGAGTSTATRFVKTRAQIDETKWKEGYSRYDGLGRIVKSQSVASDGDVFVDTEYDQYGRAWKTTNPYRAGETIYKTENFYDTAGRLYKVKTPDGAEVETAYSLSTTGNQIGTVVTVEDQANKQRRSITDALGQLTRVDEPTETSGLGAINTPNQATVYQYDALNNLTNVNQGSSQTPRTFVYDSLSRLKSATNPESGTINYQYDATGNLTQKKDARLVETNYGYDALNRVTGRTYSAPAGLTNYQTSLPVTYTYDNLPNAKGKLIKVVTGTGATPFSVTEYQEFDQLGRVTQSRQRTDGTNPDPMTYTYNLSGALIEQKYPSGRIVKNVLDADGDLSIVQSKKNANSGFWNYASNFTYTSAGAVSSMRLGNGKWESTQFNSRLQPTQIALGTLQNGTDKLKLNFGYGQAQNNGNVLSQQITVPTVGQTPGFTATQNYTYDALNRLKSAEETIPSQTGWKQTFIYDRYGNRSFDEGGTSGNYQTTTLTRNCSTSTYNPNGICNKKAVNPTFAADNRIVQDQDGDAQNDYLFDSAGNTTRDADGKTFFYDGENKQVEVKNSSGVPLGKYFYDGDGKRVKKIAGSEVTIFVYDAAGKLVAEYANQIATPTEAKVSYLTSDHLGSPRINTDANGAVISRHDYHPFGEEIVIARGGYGTDEVRKKFTSYERDIEADLDFAQARYYNRKHGRFTSVDPENAGAREDDPQSWNGYSYTGNNPINFTDQTGLDYRICLANGNGCWTATDKEFAAYIKELPAGFIGTGDGLNGSVLDSDGNAVTNYSYFRPADQEIVGQFLEGFASKGEPWLPIVELLQPAPLPAGGAVLGGVVKATKMAKAGRTLTKAKWAKGIINYSKGAMTSIDHVIFRHGAGTTFSNVGKFATSSSRKIQRLADEAVSNLNGSQFAGPDGGVIYDFGRIIGTHADGTLTSKVQVFFNSAGEVTTMYPVK